MKRVLIATVIMAAVATGGAQASWTLITGPVNADFNWTATGYKFDIGGTYTKNDQIIATFAGFGTIPGYAWLYNHHYYCADIPQTFNNNADRTFYLTDDSAGPTGGVSGTVAGNRRAAWILNRWSYSATSALQKAALQMAIWEAIYDDGSTANFESTAGTHFWVGDILLGSAALNTENRDAFLALANSYYAGSQLDTAVYAWDSQNLMRGVPEPGTLLLLGLALAVPGVATIIRRRRS